MDRYKILLWFALFFGATPIFAETVLWLAGDSIIRHYSEAELPRCGWGQMLNELTKPGVRIENRGLSGRSLKRFMLDKNWESLMLGVKKGDFVLISFAHNDQYRNVEKYIADPAEYAARLKQCISEVRAKEATPVLVTSVPRYRFKGDNRPLQTLGEYPDAMRRIATETGTELIDLNAALTEQLRTLPMHESSEFYLLKKIPGKDDREHLTVAGARNAARIAVAEAKKHSLSVAELFR